MSGRWTATRAVLLVLALGLFLRLWAAARLPTDFDEPVYMQAGLDYADRMRAGDWAGIIDYPLNREHPPLVKLMYGAAALTLDERAGLATLRPLARTVSALFGALAVGLLALFDPLAGGLLAVHTIAVKYTSQAYLEAIPALAALAAVLAMQRSRQRRDRWFWFSALALGLTAAGKFNYLVILFPLAYLILWEMRPPWRDVLLYALVALLTFVLLDPTLWHDPLGRLRAQLFFHTAYAQSSRVELAGLPWYQPLRWLSSSMPGQWHPAVFFYRGFDGLMFLLALAGLPYAWRQRRWVVVWLVAGVLVLLLWPTKWPQYTLTVTPAVCLAAAGTLRQLWQGLQSQTILMDALHDLLPRPSRAVWVALAAVAVLLAAATLTNELKQATEARGWSHYTTANSPLPSDTVWDLDRTPDGGMVLGTARGAAVWTPPAEGRREGSWMLFDRANSGLAHDTVNAVLAAPDGTLWFGTDAGLSRYADRTWRTFTAADGDLPGRQVRALDWGHDGSLWVGADGGLARYAGGQWTAYTTANSGLVNDFVMAVATAPGPEGEVVWVATVEGISRFDPARDVWQSYTAENSGLSWDGVADILVDSRGRVWAATLGGGLDRLDGDRWQVYRVINSSLPYNLVMTLAELEPGVIWLGTAQGMYAGGALTRFDGAHWRTWTGEGSGYSGAEASALARDRDGRLWIGTLTAGVEVYELPVAP